MKMLGESVNMVVTQRIRDQVGLLIDNSIKKGVWFHYDEHMGLQQASRNEERFLAHKVEILNEND